MNKLLQTTFLALHCTVMYYKLLYFRMSKQECTTQQPWGLASLYLIGWLWLHIPLWVCWSSRDTIWEVWNGQCIAWHICTQQVLPHLQWHNKHDSAVVSLQARLSNADGIPG